MHSKSHFTLGDQNAGVFAEICKKNGMPHCWLQWKFELAVLNEATTPVSIDTKSDPVCGLNNGCNKVVFTIDFEMSNSNVINYVKFTEYYEDCEKKHFIVTQTSVDHIHEDTGCDLWIELPSTAIHEDICSLMSMWKVNICCDGWKDFLPNSPVTQLEKAHRVIAADNAEWLKKQLMRTVGVVKYKNMELAAKKKDIEDLTTHISEVSMKLAGAEKQLEDIRMRDVAATPLKRKMLTPKSRARKAPETAPARTSTAHPAGSSGQDQTPSKQPKFVLKVSDVDDPFVID
ncbi:hypothetical protein Daus18300_001686 [Diaporthe australafricana]|uniref:Uncharacterized protein n=1 Tax=Diaporthe australafricana TaxID=127596 RepID=A0ABR3XW51_9PEZI